ncbi:MAG: FGGY family carbohydrate kinase [Granulicella sp.]
MNEPVYIGIDIGTQSTRVMAVTETGDIVATASRPLTSHREGPRHEQQPDDWWRAVAESLRSVTSELGSSSPVRGLCVDATSGTILLVDKEGRPVTPGLMYDDARANAEAIEVDQKGAALWEQLSYRVQPSWALPKLLWLLRHGAAPHTYRLMHQNDWINFRLAGHPLSTDSSHALKTGYDLLQSHWPSDIFDTLGIPTNMLPEVVAPGTRIGSVSTVCATETGLPAGTPIYAGMTDGCAAQIASGAVGIGDWNTVIGTTLVVKGVTRNLLCDPLRAVYSHRSMDGLWLPGGASSTGASAITAAFKSEDLPALNKHAEHAQPTPLVIYPLATRGERFPFAAPDAEGFTLGVARSTEEHYQAVLQGIALWERLSFDALRAMGAPMEGRFTISGGATRSHALNQMRADAMQRTLTIPAVTEGAFGMAILASAAESSLTDAVSRMIKPGVPIHPKRPFSDYAPQYHLLLSELHRRGWLPDSLFATASQEANA